MSGDNSFEGFRGNIRRYNERRAFLLYMEGASRSSTAVTNLDSLKIGPVDTLQAESFGVSMGISDNLRRDVLFYCVCEVCFTVELRLETIVRFSTSYLDLFHIRMQLLLLL